MELVYYLGIINVIAFLIYGLDKRKAVKNKWRISENLLLFIAFLGGGVGSVFGMWFFRHKTQKTKFRIGIPLLALLSIIWIVLLYRMY